MAIKIKKPLCKKVEYTAKREELSRKLEHLRRVNNPDNYNEDGTVKKGTIAENGKRNQ